MSSEYFWTKRERIAGLIELLITCHPQGFQILLGEVGEPESREIHEMMNSIREKMPNDFIPTMPNLTTEAERIIFDREYFDKLVEMAGGWEHIHEVSKECKEIDSRRWGVVIAHIKYVQNSGSRYESKLSYVASRYGLSTKTVTKYRKEFSQKLAMALLMPPGEGDNFYLLPS